MGRIRAPRNTKMTLPDDPAIIQQQSTRLYLCSDITVNRSLKYASRRWIRDAARWLNHRRALQMRPKARRDGVIHGEAVASMARLVKSADASF